MLCVLMLFALCHLHAYPGGGDTIIDTVIEYLTQVLIGLRDLALTNQIAAFCFTIV